jgi:hypothetical protein
MKQYSKTSSTFKQKIIGLSKPIIKFKKNIFKTKADIFGLKFKGLGCHEFLVLHVSQGTNLSMISRIVVGVSNCHFLG